MIRIALLALALTGCAALPDTVRPEYEHMSHATQHFGANHTNYGANMASIILHWDAPKNTYVEVGEGLDLDRHYRDINSYGAIIGPREEFTFRVGMNIKVPK